MTELDLWQPIETAPKDEIVLVYDDGFIGKAILNDSGQWCDVEIDGTSIFNPPPTHWMPMPLPPTGLEIKMSLWACRTCGGLHGPAQSGYNTCPKCGAMLDRAEIGEFTPFAEDEWIDYGSETVKPAREHSWQWRYEAEARIVDEVWAALGISTFKQAQGKHIADIVRELKAELVELKRDTVTCVECGRSKNAGCHRHSWVPGSGVFWHEFIEP